jgi:hypothetical protein
VTRTAGQRASQRSVAYVDESQRSSHYLMAAVAIDSSTLAEVRRVVGQFRPGGGQARRHFVKESAATRRKLLDAYRALPGVSIVVADDQRGDSAVDQRRRCVSLLVGALLPFGVDRIVFDHTDSVQRDRDRQVLAPLLAQTGVAYSHEVAHTTEPMLWIPDAVAWCAGAKPEWRAQLEGWVTIHRT